MPRVLDLIEIGFRNELDPQGWKMLDQMRRYYVSNPLTSLVRGVAMDTTGFVYIEDGVIVGNLSLRHALPRDSRGRLIGNVVVDPDHRGQGIGRALMERAIKAAHQDHADWVGLEVRADNAVACQLYRHLGFRAVGKTEHLIRPGGIGWPNYPRPDRNWRRSKPKDAVHWRDLATLIHNHDQRRVLEIRTNLYRFGGLERRISLWLTRQAEKAWVYEEDEKGISLAAHLEIDRRYRFHAWDILMRPDLGKARAEELIARCLAGSHRLPPWPVVTIVPDQPELIGALQDIAFQPHRTLQQMMLELKV
ncbi:MAG: GNAT family N-acetyltransferase [Anaerolineae bacterium]